MNQTSSHIIPDAYKRILFIDRDVQLCQLVKCHVDNTLYSINTISNADDTFDLDPDQYDAIVVDYSLPGFDAYDFVENISLVSSMTALLVTADTANMAKAYETLDVGADTIIRKPFSAKTLVAHLNAIMRRRTTSHN